MSSVNGIKDIQKVLPNKTFYLEVALLALFVNPALTNQSSHSCMTIDQSLTPPCQSRLSWIILILLFRKFLPSSMISLSLSIIFVVIVNKNSVESSQLGNSMFRLSCIIVCYWESRCDIGAQVVYQLVTQLQYVQPHLNHKDWSKRTVDIEVQRCQNKHTCKPCSDGNLQLYMT